MKKDKREEEKEEEENQTTILYEINDEATEVETEISKEPKEKEKEEENQKTEFEYSENRMILNQEQEEESKESEYKKASKEYDDHTTAKFKKEPQVKSNSNFNENSELVDRTETTETVETMSEIKSSNIQEYTIDYIEECIKTNQIKTFIANMNEELDYESTSSIFDRVYFEKGAIYEEFCKEGVLQNNAVSHHKYGHLLIDKMNKEYHDETTRHFYMNEARKHFEESISRGFNRSYFSLSILEQEYFKNVEKSFQLAKEGSERGDVFSKCLLGYYISRGIGTEKSLSRGISIMISSGFKEFYEVFSTDIGLYYVEKYNDKLIKENEEENYSRKAFEFFKKAYENNKTQATINNYGICFMIGFGVEIDMKKATEIFNEGSKFGYSISRYHLSFIEETSQEEEKEKEKILKQIREKKVIPIRKKSKIEQETSKSSELAKKYSQENDSENTYTYMKKSISEGDTDVALEYAIHLYRTKHFKESIKYFIELSEKNHPIAKYFIGVMKYFGQGCTEDRLESHNIMSYLSKEGITQATEFIEDYFDN